MNNRQLLGIAGAALLFVGVFMPIVKIPIVGDTNYIQNGKGDGIFILVFAVGSFVLVLARQYKGLWLTSIGSAALMAFTFFNFQSKMSQMKAQMEIDLAGNPFRGLADIAAQSIQLQWGCAVLVIGVVILMATAAMNEPSTQPPTRAAPGEVKPAAQLIPQPGNTSHPLDQRIVLVIAFVAAAGVLFLLADRYFLSRAIDQTPTVPAVASPAAAPTPASPGSEAPGGAHSPRSRPPFTGRRRESVPAPAAKGADLSKDELMKAGEKVYNTQCAACHQAAGQGLPPHFPSLVGSKVVAGPSAAHITHTLSGKGLMPPFTHLSDADLAAALTYERNSWGNKSGVVQASAVAAARKPSISAERTPTVASGGESAAVLNQLVLEFSETSFVRIEDSRNKTLAIGLVRGGERQALDGTPPYSVFLGDAQNAKVFFNGQPVDFSAHINSQNDTARFTVP